MGSFSGHRIKHELGMFTESVIYFYGLFLSELEICKQRDFHLG